MALIEGPGILYVDSKLTQPELLDEGAYMDWYDNSHIAEILGTSGINSALRFKNVNLKHNTPYLAVFPMSDIGFTLGEEFKSIGVHSPLLPEDASIHDLAEFHEKYLKLVDVFDPTNKGKGKHCRKRQSFSDHLVTYSREHAKHHLNPDRVRAISHSGLTEPVV